MPPDSGCLRRGDLYWVDWSPSPGSEQSGRRPALIVQLDPANRNTTYPNTIVVTISRSGRDVPSHVPIDPAPGNGLRERSYAKCEQILTVNKDRLAGRIGHVTEETMAKVSDALKRMLAIE
ncbi:MAG TPA: type II toxin-antitoxin system PemK/MazF family toxin [Armatimonadota bacterium]|jgi:mRNA interferase MazF